MNLVPAKTEACKFSYFRAFQFSYIIDYLDNVIDYCIEHGFSTDGYRQINVQTPISYHNYNYKAIDSYKIDLIKPVNNNQKPFLHIVVPKLVDNTFFILKDVKYIPAVYIMDGPIITKVKSIMLSSMFFPITIYFKNLRVNICGVNFSVESFFQLLFDYSISLEYCELLGIKHLSYISDEDVYKQYASILSCKPNRDMIIQKLDSLFFDRWTKELYQTMYDLKNDELTLPNIVHIAINRLTNKPHFTDLANKRLVFIEQILKPIAKAVNSTIRHLLTKPRHKTTLQYLNLAQDDILKNFIKNLHANYFYDTVNGFTSILSHKASFKNPLSNGQLPFEVASVHESHKGKICPVSISSQNPGETVSIVPIQDIDFKYGVFTGL